MERNRYKKAYGDAGEDFAVEYLKNAGYQILERNFRCRQGEIDIIAKENRYLCFIEVKRRKNTATGHPLESIHKKKIHSICRTALYYLQSHSITDSTPVRFDVISVVCEDVLLLRDAFSFHY